MTQYPRYRLLFVCMGNICRSPAAEGVMNKLLRDEGLDELTLIDSAGTISFHSGSPADPRMKESARKRGIELESRARQVKPEDFEKFDLILTMDGNNYRDVRNMADSETDRQKVKKFTDFCMEHTHQEVPDPYYGAHDGFEEVLDLLEDGCKQLLETLLKR